MFLSKIKNRISNQQLLQKQYENKMNENALLNDLHGWRDVISNTLNVIEKVICLR